MLSLSENIKAGRKKVGLTQEELANKLGVKKQTVQKYESGIITNIPSDNIEKMAVIFETTPADLMGWNEIKLVPKPGNELDETLAKDFNRLTPEEQKIILAQIKWLLSNHK